MTSQTEEPNLTDEPSEPVEPVEPADAVDPTVVGTAVELHTERGSLTLRPNQTELDEHQRAGLVAIGIDIKNDPQIEVHVPAFIHMCQAKGLDPWSKEAYLIGRGQGANRKYTMQTGIDGYRKMAASTNRFIRVKDRLWTGADDDDRSYIAVDDGHGGVVMRRVWFDQWPASRGWPGSAKCTIEHYDDYGNVVETSAVADWGMYAPVYPKWVWGERRGEKVYLTNDDGTPQVELNDMWEKGYSHMLAKTAEALAHRIAFPARMSGVYTHEEMHRLDQMEQARLDAENRTVRQAAYAAVTSKATARRAATPDAPDDDYGPSGPIPLADVVNETVAGMAASTAPSDNTVTASPEQQCKWLRTELDYQGGILGHTPAALASRTVKALRKNVEQFTVEDLFPLVVGLRVAVVAKLRAAGSHEEADAYAGVGDTVTDVMAVIAGEPVDGEVVPDDEPVNPEEEHEFDGDDPDEDCNVCGLVEGLGPHPE